MVQQMVMKSFLWTVALICLFFGSYVAINHSYQLLLEYNFSLAPLGDQAKDMAEIIYPILTGEKSWRYLFQPFADHRIVIERLLIMYDFFFHQGMENIHPYREVAVFWVILGLFSAVIFTIQKIPFNIKLIITGCAATLLFAGVSLSNFYLTICFTWPLVMMFSLFCFIMLSRYCYVCEHQQKTLALVHLLLVSISILFTLFTFNIGLILWPIVFIVLFKRQVWRQHIFLWGIMAVLSYLAYFWSGWHPGITATDQGLKNSILHPIHPFLYMSRILSIPLIANASTTVTMGVVLIGLFISFLSIYYLIKYWKLTKWTASDTIIFSYLLFCFATLIIISMMRSWIPGEYFEVGGRCVTASLILWLCLLVSAYVFYYKVENHRISLANCIFSGAIGIWLVVFFIPADRNIYNASISNQHAIALSAGIPVDKAFIDYSTSYANGDQSSFDHSYIDNIYKKNQKGIYSLWVAQQINKSIDEMPFSISASCKVNHTLASVKADLRKMGNPAIVIQSQFISSKLLSSFNLVFTDQYGKIVGYSLPLANLNLSLWDKLLAKQNHQIQSWQGVVNSALVHGNVIQSWLIDKQQQKRCMSHIF